MKGKLNKARIDYVLYHLRLCLDVPLNLLKKIRFSDTTDLEDGGIIFLQSPAEFNINSIKSIQGIEVLFPLGNDNQLYRIQNKTLIFQHDLIKSAFYLLSGYQEYANPLKDKIGRFPFQSSVQKELGIIYKPLVNYYFKVITDAFTEYSKIYGLPPPRQKQLFRNFGFLLTHDVDRIDTYNIFEVLYKIKQYLGKAPSPYDKRTLNKLILKYILNFINFSRRDNPFWTFQYLINEETKKNGFKSVYFFLNREGLHKNSRYRFNDRRIRKLIHQLMNENYEIALHGTIQSAENLFSMAQSKELLEKVTGRAIHGIRQHYLKCDLPETFRLQQNAGLQWDSTLGFAEHEGFRNSYCLPFRIFDFDNDQMLDIWEYPLILMDTTLTTYRELSFDKSCQIILNLIKEIKSFNGLFTLLWHNCHFDEHAFPGITEFYSRLLMRISELEPDNVLGDEIKARLDSLQTSL